MDNHIYKASSVVECAVLHILRARAPAVTFFNGFPLFQGKPSHSKVLPGSFVEYKISSFPLPQF